MCEWIRMCSVCNAYEANRTKWKLNIAWPGLARPGLICNSLYRMRFENCVWMNRCKNTFRIERKTNNLSLSLLFSFSASLLLILQYAISHFLSFKNKAIAGMWAQRDVHAGVYAWIRVCVCVCMSKLTVGWLNSIVQTLQYLPCKWIVSAWRAFDCLKIVFGCFTDSAIFGMHSIGFLSIGTCY